MFGSSCTILFRRTYGFIFIDSSHVHEVCSSQDTSCSQQTISSAHDQQPSCYSEVISTSQGTSSEADTSTFQGTSCPQQSDVHVVIDLSNTHYSTPRPTTPPDSVELSGLQIYKADVQTVQPKAMITDTIVLFLFKWVWFIILYVFLVARKLWLQFLVLLCARAMSLHKLHIWFCIVVSGNYPRLYIPLSVPFSIPLYVGNKMSVKHPQGTDLKYTQLF